MVLTEYYNYRTFVPTSLEKHQKSCTKANPSGRSTKEKNFTARASIENTLATSNKKKYLVMEDDEGSKSIERPKTALSKSSQPIYVSIKRSSKADLQ